MWDEKLATKIPVSRIAVAMTRSSPQISHAHTCECHFLIFLLQHTWSSSVYQADFPQLEICVCVWNPFCSVNLSSMCRKYSSPLHRFWRQPAKMLISDVSTVGVNVQDLSTKNSCRTSGILTNFWRLCSNIIPNWILAAEMFCRFSINKLEESAVVFFRSDRAQTISERDGVKREISSRVVIIRNSYFTFGPYRNW